MALQLTESQRTLLRSGNLKVRILTEWRVDGGTVYFSDDPDDFVWEGNTYIGAAALASVSEIKSSGAGMAAEPIKILIDGTRMKQAGFEDPAEFFREILEQPLHNRKLFVSAAFGYHNEAGWEFVLPLFSGKINYTKLVDPAVPMSRGSTHEDITPNLEIVIDSLAIRYRWVTQRTRSHEDQLEIDPTDMFFSFVHGNLRGESTLYWGKKAPGSTLSQQPTAAQQLMIRFFTGRSWESWSGQGR